MRIRSLKPGFFKNEELAELSPWHRLCFEGLWCCGDKAGRLQDRPKRLKAEIFPYDDLNVDMLLWDLTRAGFVVRYQANGHPYIWIPTFLDHQHPRPDEAESEIPAFEPGMERPGGPAPTTFPAAMPSSTLPGEQGLTVDMTVVTGIDTDPLLSSRGPVTTARSGSGVLGLGSGVLEMGIGITPATATAAQVPPCRAQDLIDLWNATTKPPLPRCRELTDQRRQKIRGRLRARPSLADWREGYEYINAVAFYRGENDRHWIADFDWTIKNDTVLAKVLERARTPTRGEVAYDARTCDHVPRCENPGNWQCQQRTQLAQAKASA